MKDNINISLTKDNAKLLLEAINFVIKFVPEGNLNWILKSVRNSICIQF